MIKISDGARAIAQPYVKGKSWDLSYTAYKNLFLKELAWNCKK